MDSVEFLSEEIRKGLSDGPWHGPSIAELLHDVTADEAAAHPVAGVHSIWEIVLHLVGWNGEVRGRLEGGVPSMPREGDWPAVGEATEASWKELRERLDGSVSALRETLAGTGEERLDRRGGWLDAPPPGTSGTSRGMVNGIVQHLAYHGGQIALLKKALRNIR